MYFLLTDADTFNNITSTKSVRWSLRGGLIQGLSPNPMGALRGNLPKAGMIGGYLILMMPILGFHIELDELEDEEATP